MPTRSVDIIIPIYKNADLVDACVRSVLAYLHEIEDRDPRVILINDSPGDGGVEALLPQLAATDDRVQVLRNEVNKGFVRSVNRGLALSLRDGRDVVLINSDTLTFEGTLRNLLAASQAIPEIGFASPRSNNASICSLPHFYGGVPATPSEAYERWRVLSATMPDWQFAPTAVGFYMYIAFSVLADHGLLREDFGPGYEEENDLVLRAGKVGRRAILVNNAFAFHAGSASFALTDLSLSEHRHQNYLKLTATHPEFPTLVGRYEKSPAFRAERLLSGLLPDPDGRYRLIFDLSGLGMHHNGTNEHAIAVVRSMAARWSKQYRITGLASAESFKFHGLDKIEQLHREDPGTAGVCAIAIRLSQPFDLHHINVLEHLAPINIYAMLDTISEDCGPLNAATDLGPLWDYVAERANGLLFISRYAEHAYCIRHPAAAAKPRMACLLPTRLSEYRKAERDAVPRHVLIVGNHFPHKGVDAAVQQLAAAYPALRFAVIGSQSGQSGNVQTFRAGVLEQQQVESLFLGASVVVLPSHMEGFGFSLMHALAAQKPIVARRIPATEEILETLDHTESVFLFETNADIVSAFAQALGAPRSFVDDSRGVTWHDWADGVGKMCAEAIASDNIFETLVRRHAAGDQLRKEAAWAEAHKASDGHPAVAPASGRDGRSGKIAFSGAKTVNLSALMNLNGREFVEYAYATILRRPADSSGLAYYVSQLENGSPKAEVLRALRTSSEGKAQTDHLAGLDELLTSYARGKRSLIKQLMGR